MNTTDNMTAVAAEINQPTTAPPTKDEVLRNLLQSITPVNFHQLLNNPEDSQISKTEYRVCIIQELLRTAKEQSWNMCRKNGMTYVYNSAYWIMLDPDDMRLFLGKAAYNMGINRIDAADYRFKNELVNQFNAEAHLRTRDRNHDQILINLMDGTYVFSNGELSRKDFDPDDFLTYQLPFSYNPTATAPIFERYLNRVLPMDERQTVLAEFIGSIFAPELNTEKALFLYGDGENGKSVFSDILQQLLGTTNCSSFSLTSLTSPGNQGLYTRAKFNNKLVNYGSEFGGNIDKAIFKQLVSREPVEARHPYGKPFNTKQYGRLIFNANGLPITAELTHAFFRRFLIIPFDVKITPEEKDPQLSEKIISNELSGVFNWVLEGLKRLIIQNGFTACDSCERVLSQYRIDVDSVALFLSESNLRPSIDETIPNPDIYELYRNFCRMDGYMPVGNRNFKKEPNYEDSALVEKHGHCNSCRICTNHHHHR